MKRFLRTSLAIVIGVLSASILIAGGTLDYQDRGNRWEGIKPLPVSGSDIELISAIADFVEPGTYVPAQLRVRFYLPSQTPAYLTVRELDNHFFYWMDEVRPPEEWSPGFRNEFTWGSAPVLHTLFNQGLRWSDLGAVLRLGKKVPSGIERVAPTILYHSSIPREVEGYLFTLKTAADASVRCSVYREGEERPMAVEAFRRVRGGRPFTMHWDASQAEPGKYRLVASGHFLDDNQAVVQTVHFHHQRVIQ